MLCTKRRKTVPRFKADQTGKGAGAMVSLHKKTKTGRKKNQSPVQKEIGKEPTRHGLSKKIPTDSAGGYKILNLRLWGGGGPKCWKEEHQTKFWRKKSTGIAPGKTQGKGQLNRKKAITWTGESIKKTRRTNQKRGAGKVGELVRNRKTTLVDQDRQKLGPCFRIRERSNAGTCHTG